MEIKTKFLRLLDAVEGYIAPHRAWDEAEYVARNETRLREWLAAQDTSTQEYIQTFSDFIKSLQNYGFYGTEALVVGSTTFAPNVRLHRPHDVDIRILFPQDAVMKRIEAANSFKGQFRDFLRDQFGRFEESSQTEYRTFSIQRMSDPATGATFEQAIPGIRYDTNDPSFTTALNKNLLLHVSLCGEDKLPTPLYMEGEFFLGKSSGILIQ